MGAHHRLFGPEGTTRSLEVQHLVGTLFALKHAWPAQGRQRGSIQNRELVYDAPARGVEKGMFSPRCTPTFGARACSGEDSSGPGEGRSCRGRSPPPLKKSQNAFPRSSCAFETTGTLRAMTQTQSRPPAPTSRGNCPLVRCFTPPMLRFHGASAVRARAERAERDWVGIPAL